MDAQLVICERKDDVVWVTLNHPDSMNALSGAMLEQLGHAADDLHGDATVRCVVLTGAGKAFCAGGDLHGFRADLAEPGTERFLNKLRDGQKAFDKVAALSMPVIAAVNGYAIAGGLELLLCCDMIVAAESAKIGDGHARFGIIPAGGSSARLPRKLSANRANYLLLSGELLSVRTLEQWGLVNRVVPDAELIDAAAMLSSSLAKLSPRGLRSIKALLGNSMTVSTQEAMHAEIDTFAEYATSRDFAEGLAAFAEKRQPKFTGE